MNRSDYISIKRDSDYFDFEENFANDNLLFESYEYLLSNIAIEDADSIEKTWDEKNICVEGLFKELPLEICKEIFAKLNEKDTNSALLVDVNWNKINLTVVKDQEFSKIANFVNILLLHLDDKYPIQNQQFKDLIKLSLALCPYNKPLTSAEIKCEIELLKKELKEIILSLPFDELNKFVDLFKDKNSKLFCLLLDATLNKLFEGEIEYKQIYKLLEKGAVKLLEKGAVPTEEILNLVSKSKWYINVETKDLLLNVTLKAGIVPLENLLNYALKWNVYIETLEAILKEMTKARFAPSADILKYALQHSDTSVIKALVEATPEAEVEDALKFANEFYVNPKIVILLKAGLDKNFIINPLDKLVRGVFSIQEIDDLLNKGAIPTEKTLNHILERTTITSKDAKNTLIKATLKAGIVPLDDILKYAIKFDVYFPTIETILKEMSKLGQFPSEESLALAKNKKYISEVFRKNL